MRFLRSQLNCAVAVAAAGLLVAVAAGCNQQPATSRDQQAQTSASQAPALKVVRPEKKDVRRLIKRPGYILAYERTPLYAKIAGYVLKWNADMGDKVRKNQILAELYVPEMEVELKQKQAAVQQASAEIKQADAALLRARFELQRANSQYQRMAMLRRDGQLSKDQEDEFRLGFEAAQAALAKAEADLEASRARLKVADADKDHVETLLQYTKLPAPFDGVITGRRIISVGDFVQPGGTSKGEAIFVVEKIKPVRIFIPVQELDAIWVRERDAALIRVQSLGWQEFKGEVTRVSRSLDRQNLTLTTQIDLPNEDEKLLPGMYVNVTIIAEHKNTWALPEAAVLTQGEQSFCYRVENGKAVRTPIQLGLHGTEWVEVSKILAQPATSAEGSQWRDVTGEEAVVASNVGSLADGQAIGGPSRK
jgi:RND family efflux transporter MFP subunit